ncbi:hypothetical protein [Oceanihabitans sp. IOP_32]|nr:hypothetical protein [Oceanihabitans sp. IOP_32]
MKKKPEACLAKSYFAKPYFCCFNVSLPEVVFRLKLIELVLWPWLG